MRLCIALVVVCALAGCKKSDPPAGGGGAPGGKRPPMAFPVETRPVELRRVEYVVTATGSLEAYERIQITSRVGGAVEKVRFADGAEVKAGDVLAEIEPQRYQVAVRSAQASLARASAGQADAAAGVARREEAVKANPGLIAGEEIESWRTKERLSAAEAAQARAALELAELNLRDAYVRAPVGGTIETKNVQTGQYVQPGTVLATLVRRDPLLLKFPVTEAEAERLAVGAQVRFVIRAGAGEGVAKVTHVPQSADPETRTVHVVAEVDPAYRDRFRPGAFAEVTVPVGGTKESAVIPELAIRPSERGFLGFVVEDGVARERVLQLGLRTSDGMVEVRDGLKGGEVLVVRGAEALKDGAAVRSGAAAK